MGFRGYRTSRDRASVTRDAFGTLRALRHLPVVAQELAFPQVMPATIPEELLVEDAALPVAGLNQRPPRSLVLHERFSLELVQVQLAERVARAQRHDLRGDAFAPKRLLPDDDPGRAVAVGPADPANPRRADELTAD